MLLQAGSKHFFMWNTSIVLSKIMIVEPFNKFWMFSASSNQILKFSFSMIRYYLNTLFCTFTLDFRLRAQEI